MDIFVLDLNQGEFPEKPDTVNVTEINHSTGLSEMDNMAGHKGSRSQGLLTEFQLDLPRKNRRQDGTDVRGESEHCSRAFASGPNNNCGCQAFRRAP
jgi:hypothetical protein